MQDKQPIFRICGQALLLIAIGMLILPVQWVIAWCVAASIHELGHVLVLKLFRVRIDQIEIGINGATIVTNTMTIFQEAVCTVAGPVAGLLPLLFARRFPYIAVAGAIQSCYNALPVFPLDGGRVLRCVLAQMFTQKTAEKISTAVSICIVTISLAAGVYLSLAYHLGIIPILMPSLPLSIVLLKNTLQRSKKDSTIAGEYN